MILTKVTNFARMRERERIDAVTAQIEEITASNEEIHAENTDLRAKLDAFCDHFGLNFADAGDGIKKLVERVKEKGSSENPYTILVFPYAVAPGVHYEYKGVTYRYDGAKAQTVMRLTSDFVEVDN